MRRFLPIFLVVLSGCSEAAVFRKDLIHWRVRAAYPGEEAPRDCEGGGWFPMIFPGRLQDFAVNTDQTARVYWFCSRFQLEKKTHPSLLLRTGRICGDFTVFLNGLALVSGTSTCAAEALDADARILQDNEIDLPDGLLGETNVVLIRYQSAKTQDEGIVGSIPGLFERNSFRAGRTFQNSLKFSMIFFMFGLGVIFVLSFLRHPAALDYFFMGSFLICAALWSFAVEGIRFAPGTLLQSGRKVEIVLTLMMVAFYSHFIVHFVSRRGWLIPMRVADATGLLGAALVIFGGSVFTARDAMWAVFLLALAYLTIIVVHLVRMALAGTARVGRLIVFSSVVSLVAGFDGVNRQLLLFPDLFSVNLTLYALVLISLSVSVVFMSRYRHLLVQFEAEREAAAAKAWEHRPPE